MTIPMYEGLCALSQKESNMQFEDYRLLRLQETIKYASKESPWYKYKLPDVKIDCIEDIQKLPFTEPNAVVLGGHQFLCTSFSEGTKSVTFDDSEGTIYFSPKDIEAMTDFLGAVVHSIAPRGCTIQILISKYSSYNLENLLKNGIEKFGSKAFISDICLSIEEHIRLCIQNRPYLWIGDARLIYRITKEMERKYDLRSLGVKAIIAAIGDISDSMKYSLEDAWGCKVVTGYSVAGIGPWLAFDCPMGCGYHYNEFGVIAEVVDPETGEAVEDGEEGELVFTSLGREAMPLIRYRSNDIASIKKGPCACGAKLTTISRVRRRREAVVSYKGWELYPTMFDSLMFRNDKVIDYEVYLNVEEGIIRFEVECIDADPNYVKDISRTLCRHPALRELEIDIKLLPLHALVSRTYLKKLIHIEGTYEIK